MLFLVLAILLNLSIQPGESFYVSPSGDNSASGSIEHPWATIQYAVTNQAIGAGDTIYIMPGRYSENILVSDANGGISGRPGQPITLKAYDANNPPIISGPEQTLQLKIENRSHLIIENLTFADYLGGGILIVASDADVTDITLRNNRFLRQNVEEKNNWWNVINLYGPNQTYSVSQAYVIGNELIDTVTGFRGKANENLSLTGNVRYVLIEGNLFRHVSNIAIDLLGKAYKAIDGQPAYVLVRNNRFETVTPGQGNGKAIYFDGAAGPVVIEDNFVQDAVGVHTNIERNNNGDNTFARYLIRNNIIDNRGSDIGPSLMIGSGSYGNTDPWPVEPKRVTVVHNVVLTRAEAPPLFWGQGEEFRFKNNVIAGFGAKALSGENRNGFADASTWLSNGNLYYAGGGGETFVWPGSGRYDSLREFQRATEQEMDGIVGRPIFADLSQEDFRLAPFSPGFGQAIPLTHAVNAGRNSTSLFVEDASYFFDGFGLVEGDRIRLNDRVATVAQVDYDANHIVLSSPTTWDAGAPIGYAKSGPYPSMGLASALECQPNFLCQALFQLRIWLTRLPWSVDS